MQLIINSVNPTQMFIHLVNTLFLLPPVLLTITISQRQIANVQQKKTDKKKDNNDHTNEGK